MTENDKVAALIEDIEDLMHRSHNDQEGCPVVFVGDLRMKLQNHRPLKPAEECTPEEALEIVRVACGGDDWKDIDTHSNGTRFTFEHTFDFGCDKVTSQMRPYVAKAYGIEI